MRNQATYITNIDHNERFDKLYSLKFALQMISKNYELVKIGGNKNAQVIDAINKHYKFHHDREPAWNEPQDNIQAYHCEILDWWVIIEFEEN